MSVSLACIVTISTLSEFLLLKESFELFHGASYAWYVSCDQRSSIILSRHANIVTSVFSEDDVPNRCEVGSPNFSNIAAQKMNSIELAWKAPETTAVVLFDADIIITSNVIGALYDLHSNVVLSPNFYPLGMEHAASIHGYFNGGFAFTQTPLFHEWWRQAFLRSTSFYADQVVLNGLMADRGVKTLGANANIGFWRSRPGKPYETIPDVCQFIHVHLFQPLRTTRDWLDRRFALHALKFLRGSTIKEHNIIFESVLSKDTSGWYEASLQLS